MDRKEFDNMEVIEQLQYVNTELKNGESLRGISNNFNMSKSTIRDRFRKIGYVFDTDKRQYVKENSKKEYKNNTNAAQEKVTNSRPTKNEYKQNTNIFNQNEIEQIKEMLEWYNKQKNIIEPIELKIDTTKFTGEVKTTTVRLYSDVWNEFKKFTEQYKEFKNQDIISMALIEFMRKYRK